MVLYMMVRLPDEQLLKTIIDTVVAHDLMFSVAKKPEELLPKVEMWEKIKPLAEPKTEDLITFKEEENGQGFLHQIQLSQPSASGEPEPLTDSFFPASSSRSELNALELLLPSGCVEEDFEEEEEAPELSVKDVLVGKKRPYKRYKDSATHALELLGEEFYKEESPVSSTNPSGRIRDRSPNNIKRYRKKECQICHKLFMVPFFRTKIQHATIHFQFKRYACNQCPWKTMHACTIRQHVLKLHPMVPDAGNTGAGYSDVMTAEQHRELEELAEKCFPGRS